MCKFNDSTFYRRFDLRSELCFAGSVLDETYEESNLRKLSFDGFVNKEADFLKKELVSFVKNDERSSLCIGSSVDLFTLIDKKLDNDVIMFNDGKIEDLEGLHIFSYFKQYQNGCFGLVDTKLDFEGFIDNIRLGCTSSWIKHLKMWFFNVFERLVIKEFKGVSEEDFLSYIKDLREKSGFSRIENLTFEDFRVYLHPYFIKYKKGV